MSRFIPNRNIIRLLNKLLSCFVAFAIVLTSNNLLFVVVAQSLTSSGTELIEEKTNSTGGGSESGSELTPTPTDKPDLTPTPTKKSKPIDDSAKIKSGDFVQDVQEMVSFSNEVQIKIANIEIEGKSDGEELSNIDVIEELTKIDTTVKELEDVKSGGNQGVLNQIGDLFVSSSNETTVNSDSGSELVNQNELEKEVEDLVKEKITNENIAAEYFEVKINDEIIDDDELNFEAGSVVLNFIPDENLEPGVHTFEFEFTNPLTGDTEIIQQDFAWGVLAMNTHQDKYIPGQIAEIQIGVLDDEGMPTCTADINLEVTSPTNQLSNPEVQVNDDICELFDSQNIIPDYFTEYEFKDGAGDYEFKLTADTENGIRILEQTVTVEEDPSFIITRELATRLYPYDVSTSKFSIDFFSDYNGRIIESVDKDIEIVSTTGNVVDKTISWDVDVTSGDIVNFEYVYDAIDKSPELLEVGPIEFEINMTDFSETEKSAYQTNYGCDTNLSTCELEPEARTWQIANDATCTWTGTGNWSSTGNWSGCSGGLPGSTDDAVISSGTVTQDVAIDVQSFTMNGGTFNASSSDLMRVERDFTINSGTFNHNNGTVEHYGRSTSAGSSSTMYEIDMNGQSFYNLNLTSQVGGCSTIPKCKFLTGDLDVANDLYFEAPVSLDTDGYDLVVGGNTSSNGASYTTLEVWGRNSEVLDITPVTGMILQYTGGGSGTYEVHSFAPEDYPWVHFSGGKTYNMTSSEVFGNYIYVDGAGTELDFNGFDQTSIGTPNTFQIRNGGTLDTSGGNLTTTGFSCQDAGTTCEFDDSTVTITGGQNFGVDFDGDGLNFNTGTSTFIFERSTGSVPDLYFGSDVTFYNLQFINGSTGGDIYDIDTVAGGVTPNTITVTNELVIDGGSGDPLELESRISPTQYTIDVTGSFGTLDNAEIQDSILLQNGSSATPLDNPNLSSNGNNVGWFSDAVVGYLYNTSGTPLSGRDISAYSNGTFESTATTDGTGLFKVDMTGVSAGELIVVYVDDETENAVGFIRAEDEFMAMNLYQNGITLQSNDGSDLTVANMAVAHPGADTGTSTDDISSIISDTTLAGGTFTNLGTNGVRVTAGSVDLTSSSTTTISGDLEIDSDATLNTTAIVLDGVENYTNSGTLTSSTATDIQFASSGSYNFTETESGKTYQLIIPGTTTVTLQDNLSMSGFSDQVQLTGAGTFDINGFNFTASSAATVDQSATSIFRTQGTESYGNFTIDIAEGTVEYYGTGGTIQDFGATDFYNLEIDGTGTFVSSGKTIANDLIINGGIYDPLTHTYDIAGNVVIGAAGTLEGSSAILNIEGGWDNTAGGTFNSDSETVTISSDTNAAHSILGSTTFDTLILDTSAITQTYTFGDATTQTIDTLFSIPAGNLRNIQSETVGVQHNIDLNSGATLDVSTTATLDISDSHLKDQGTTYSPVPLNTADGFASSTNGNTQGWLGSNISGNLFEDVDGDTTDDGAGEPGIVSIGMRIWEDVNTNGTIDAGTDIIRDSTMTDTNGDFSFGPIESAQYLIDVYDPTGFLFSGDFTTTNPFPITISGADLTGQSIGYQFAEKDPSGNTGSFVKITENTNGFNYTFGGFDSFGTAIEGIGDMNSDGVDDLLVGAQFDDGDSGDRQGAIFILFMNSDGTVSSFERISTNDGGLSYVLSDSDQFGSSAAAIGDVDGDGVTDIAVGVERHHTTTKADAGGLLIIFLNSDGTVKNHNFIDGENTAVVVEDLNDLFGSSVAPIGDVDGNGVPDIAVGQVGYETSTDGSTFMGAVYTLLLNSDGTVSSGTIYGPSNLGGLSTFIGSNDSFGRSMTAIGDIDGNGYIDIAVGSTGYDDDSSDNAGGVVIMRLGANGTLVGDTIITDGENGFSKAIPDNYGFGSALTGTGDINGDGIFDLMIGSEGSTLDTIDIDLVYLTGTGTVSDYNNIQSGLVEIANDVINDGSSFPDELHVSDAYSSNGNLSLIGSSFSSVYIADLSDPINAPGGVEQGLEFWVKADGGTVFEDADTGGGSVDVAEDGDVVEAWHDSSIFGYHMDEANGGNPVWLENSMNFNPAIDFDGNDYVSWRESITPWFEGDAQMTNVTVLEPDSVSNMGWMDTDRDAENISYVSATIDISGGTSGSVNSFEFSVNDDYELSATDIATIDPTIFIFDYEGTTPTTNGYVNGQTYTTVDDGSPVSGDISTGVDQYRLGDSPSGSFSSFDGRISENFTYNRTLTNDELQRIQSYLGIKYGVALSADTDGDSTAGETADGINEGDYVLSDGTVVWDYSASGVYTNNIFGLARDVNQDLNTKVSQSSTDDDLGLIFATDQDFVSSNVAVTRTTSLTDKSGIMAGHDGKPASFGEAYDFGEGNAMLRTWQIQETGTVGSIYVAIPNTVSFPEGAVQKSLIISADELFDSSDTIVALTDDGTNLYASYDFTTGQYFTFAATDRRVVNYAETRNNQTINSNTSLTGQNINQPGAVFMVPDGTSVFYAGTGTSGSATTINQIPLTTPYDISTPGTIVNFDASSQLGTGRVSIELNGDGSSLFAVQHDTGQNIVHHYEFGTNYDISTLAYSVTTPTYDFSSDFEQIFDLNFADSGNRLYVYGQPFSDTSRGYVIYEYALSSAFDLDSRTFMSSTGIELLSTLTRTFDLNSDGSELYLIDRAGGSAEFRFYEFGTNYDLSTMYLADNMTFTSGNYIGLDYEPTADKIVYSGGLDDLYDTSFESRGILETSTNIGAVEGGIIARLKGDTYTNPLTDVTDINLGNVPAGLTPVYTLTDSDTTLTVTFTGNSADHADSDDVTDVTFDFADSAFTSSTAAQVTNATTYSTNLGMDFESNYPGGITPEFWVYAGNGVYEDADSGGGSVDTAEDGDVVEAWHDFSGNDYHMDETNAGSPIWRENSINFNPAIDFDGASYLSWDDGDTVWTEGDVSITNVSLVQADYAGSDMGWIDTDTADDLNDMGIMFDAVGATSGRTDTIQFGVNDDYEFDVDNITNSNVSVVAFDYTSGSATGYLGGQAYSVFEPPATGTITTTTDRYRLGEGPTGPDWDGRVAENMTYEQILTEADMQKLSTYFGIKYGVTLSADNDGDSTPGETATINEGDYVLADGTTVIWDYSANSTYHNDVFGIGYDASQFLDQRISKSEDADDLTLVISNDVDFSTSNLDGSRTQLTNESFLVLGHDNGANGFTATYDGNINSRLDRIWKVQETGTVGTVNLAISDGLQLSPGQSVAIVVSSDTTFDSGDTLYSVTTDGTSGFPYASIDFNDGEFVTLIQQSNPYITYGFDGVGDFLSSAPAETFELPSGLSSSFNISEDGTKIITGNGGGLYEYQMTTAFDPFTLSFVQSTTNVSIPNFTGVITPFSNMKISADGHLMYAVSTDSERLHAFYLPTAYSLTDIDEISTVLLTTTGATESRMVGLTVDESFSNIYIIGRDNERVERYTVANPYDLSTVVHQSDFIDISAISQISLEEKVEISRDGTKLWLSLVDESGTNRQFYQYTLSTPFDLSTATLDGEYDPNSGNTNDFPFHEIDVSSDGRYMYLGQQIGGRQIAVLTSEKAGFTETAANNGEVTGSMTITLNGDTFQDIDADDLLDHGSEVTIANLPAGLTPVFTLSNSDTVATLTFTGNATSHDDQSGTNTTDDVAIDISFDDTAFTSGSASAIEGSSYNSTRRPLYIDFITDDSSPFLVYNPPQQFSASGASLSSSLSTSGYLASYGEMGDIIEISPDGEFIIASLSSGDSGLVSNNDAANFGVPASFGVNDSEIYRDLVLDNIQDISIMDRNNKVFVHDNTGNSSTLYGFALADYRGFASTVNNETYDREFTTIYAQKTTFPNSTAIRVTPDGEKVIVQNGSGISVYSFGSPYDLDTLSLDATYTDSAAGGSSLRVAPGGYGASSVNLTNIEYYRMSSPYDFSTAVLADSFDTGISFESYLFGPGGTQLYVYSDFDDTIDTYNITGFDFFESFVNDGSISGTAQIQLYGDTFQDVDADDILDVGTEITLNGVPAGLTPVATLSNNDSTVSITFTGNATDHQDTHDISTITFTFDDTAFTGGSAASVANATGPYDANIGIDFDDNDYRLAYNFEYYDISEATYDGSRDLDLGNDQSPEDIDFNTDGSKMYILNAGVITEYTLSTNFDPSTAVAGSTLTVSTQDGLTRGIDFSADGTKLFVVGATNDKVYTYNLTAFDLSTAVHAGASIDFDVNSSEGLPGDITFNNDGTKLFVVGSDTDSVYSYELSTAYDLTTSIDGTETTLDVSTGGTTSSINGISFTDNGTRMILAVRSIGSTYLIVQYNLTTEYDLTTASYSGTDAFDQTILSTPDFEGFAFMENGASMAVLEFNTSGGASEFVRVVEFGDNQYPEALANDGSIDSTIPLTIQINETTFQDDDADDIFDVGSEVTLGNVPAGLTPVLLLSNNDTLLTLTFSGNASSHVDNDDVSDITFEFNATSFDINDHTLVTNATGPYSSNVGINFEDPTDFIGTVYSDRGTTPVGAGVSVSAVLNGVTDLGTTSTAVDGTFGITPAVAPSPGDVVTVYVDDGSQKSVAIISMKSEGSNIDLWDDTFIFKSDDGSALDQSHLVAAGAYDNTNIKYFDDSSGYVFDNDISLVFWQDTTMSFDNNMSMTESLTSDVIFWMQSDSTVTLGDGFDEKGSFSGAIDFQLDENAVYTDSSGGGTLNIDGNLTMADGADLSSLSQFLTLSGNVTIGNTSVLDGYTYIEMDGSGTTLTTNGATITDRLTISSDISLADNLAMGSSVLELLGSSAELDAAGFNISGSSTVLNTGTLKLRGTESVGLTMDADSGTVEFYGDNSGSTIDLNSFSSTYFNLDINDTNVTSNIYETTSALLVNGDLSITDGEFDANDDSHIIGGSISEAAAGTFTPDTSTIQLGGTSDQNLLGSLTFNNLSISDSGARTVGFEEDITFPISGTFTASLSSGNEVSIRTVDSAGTVLNDSSQHTLDVTAGTLGSFQYLDVRDSILNDSTGSPKDPPLDPANSTDSGNTSGWFSFVISGTVYQNEGIADSGANLTVQAVLNGSTDLGSAITDSNGDYSILVSSYPTADDIITVYIDGETENGVTITRVAGPAQLTDMDIYENYLITRSESTNPLTNTDLDTADNLDVGGGSDITDIYIAFLGTLFTSTGVELLVWTGDSFSPGGNLDLASNLDIDGNFDAGTNNVNLAGHYDLDAAGTDISTGSLIFDGTGAQQDVDASAATVTYSNVQVESNAFVQLLEDIDLGDNNLTISSSAIFSLLDDRLTMNNGTFSNEGILRVRLGSSTGVNFTGTAGMDVDSGTVEYAGYDFNAGTPNFAIEDFNPSGADYYNLTISQVYGFPVDYFFQTSEQIIVANDLEITDNSLRYDHTSGNNLQVDGNLIQTGGVFDASSASEIIDVGGNVDITAGTFTTTSGELQVGSDWKVDGGTFNNNNGTVVMDGTGQNVFGETTFYKFTKAVTAADTIGFEDTKTQVFTNFATLQGASGQLLSIRSVDATGTQQATGAGIATLDFQFSGIHNYLDVENNNADSTNSAQLLPVNPLNSTVDAGSTTDWDGAAVDLIISGVLYAEDRVTPLTSKTVGLVIADDQNLGDQKVVTTTTSDAVTGAYTFTLANDTFHVDAEDPIAVFIDNETENGMLLTDATGTDQTNLDFYQNTLTVYNGIGNIGLPELYPIWGYASNVTEDDITDIVASALYLPDFDLISLVINTGYDLFVTPGSTFTIDGSTQTLGGDIDVDGTLNMTNTTAFVGITATIAGNTDVDAAGTLNLNDSDNINFEGTVNVDGAMVLPGSSGNLRFFNNTDLSGATSVTGSAGSAYIGESGGSPAVSTVNFASSSDVANGYEDWDLVIEDGMTVNLTGSSSANSISIGTNSTLDAFGFDANSSTFSNDGTFRLYGTLAQSVSINPDGDSGTWVYYGNGSIDGCTTDTAASLEIGAYYNLVIDDVCGNSGNDTFRAVTTLTVNNDFTVDNGLVLFTANSASHTVGNDVILGNTNPNFGTIQIDTGGTDTITIGGDWTQNTSATQFVPESSTIVFTPGNGADITHTIGGTSPQINFNNLNFTEDSNAGHTYLNFGHEVALIEIAGKWTLLGTDASNQIFVRSTSAGTDNVISLPTVGGGGDVTTVLEADFADIQDNYLRTDFGVQALCPFEELYSIENPTATLVDSGNNKCWFPKTYTGTVYSDAAGTVPAGAGITVSAYSAGTILDTQVTNASSEYTLTYDDGITFRDDSLAGLVVFYLDDEANQGMSITGNSDAVSGSIFDTEIRYDQILIDSRDAAGFESDQINSAAAASDTDITDLVTDSGSNFTYNTNLRIIGSNPVLHNFLENWIVTGDFTIEDTASLTINNSFPDLTVNGNVNIQPGTTYTNSSNGANDFNGNLDLDGSVDFSGGSLALSGNLDVDAAASLTGSSVDFDGTAAQTITTNGVTLASGIDVSNTTDTVSPTDALNIGTNTLTIDSGAIFYTNGQDVTIGTLANDGTFRLNGDETTISVTTQDIDSGTWEYVGNGDGTPDEDINIIDFGATDYFNLTINSTTNPDDFVSPADLVLAGSLNIASGELDAGANTISVAGDWSNAATFTQGTSTVNLNGTSDQDVFGTTTFNNLTISDTGLRTVGFEEDLTQTVNGVFTADLTIGNEVSIRTIDNAGTVLNDGSQHTVNLDITGGASFGTADFLDVRDSILQEDGSAKDPVLAPANSTDSGNNSGWFNPSISGTVYSDRGVTTYALAETVNILANGVSIGTGTINAGDGTYSVSLTSNPNVGDVITAFIDDGTNDAVTVTRFNSGDLTGLDIYQSHLIVRTEDGTAITNSNLDTGNNADTNITAIYADATTTALDVSDDVDLLVWTGDEYAPGGNINLGGDLIANGTYTTATEDVTFDGTVAQSFNSGGNNFYDISIANTTDVVTVLTNNLTITNTLTVDSSTILSLDGNDLSLTSTLSNEGTIRLQGSESVTLTAGQDTDSGTWEFVGDGTGAATTHSLNSISTTYFNVLINDTSGSNDDTFNHNGVSLTINGNLTISDGTYDFNSNQTTVAGNFVNEANGTVIHDGTLNLTSGDLSNAGTFTSSSSVLFTADDADQQNIFGDITITTLQVTHDDDDAGGKTLGIEEDKTVTVSTQLSMNSTASDETIIRTVDNLGAILNDNSQHTINVTGSFGTVDSVDVRDSILQDGGVVKSPELNPADSINTGNTQGWFPSISGVVYSDRGATTYAIADTVRLLVDGSSIGTGTINAVDGTYSVALSGSVATGSIITAFIDDGSADAVSVTRYDSSSLLSDYDLYQDHLILRTEDGTALTNSNLDTANTGDTDLTAIYTDGTTTSLDVSDDVDLLVWTGDTFAPGGDVNVGGDLVVDGSYTAGTHDITFDGTVAQTFYTAGINFYDISIANSTDVVTISSGSLTASNTLTVESNAVLSLDGNNMFVTSTVSNEGTIRSIGSEAMTLTAGNDVDSGTWEYVGDGTGAATAQSIKDFGYYNLVINDTSATNSDTFSSLADLVVAGDLTVTDGSVNLSHNLDIEGNFTLDTAGTFGAGSGNINVAGSWANNASIGFSGASSTVILDSSGDQTITGATLFNNFTATGDRAITITAGTNLIVSNDINLYGVAGGTCSSNLTLQSSDTVTPTTASINITDGNDGGTVQCLDVNAVNQVGATSKDISTPSGSTVTNATGWQIGFNVNMNILLEGFALGENMDLMQIDFELRSGASPDTATTVDYSVTDIDLDANGNFESGDVTIPLAPGNYYVLIKPSVTQGRTNHIPVISASEYTFTTGATNVLNWSDTGSGDYVAAYAASGSAMATISSGTFTGQLGLYGGDVNADANDQINATDVSVLSGVFLCSDVNGLCTWDVVYDLNGDNIVNATDISIMTNNFLINDYTP